MTEDDHGDERVTQITLALMDEADLHAARREAIIASAYDGYRPGSDVMPPAPWDRSGAFGVVTWFALVAGCVALGIAIGRAL
jgi:hypothetical protein